MGLRFTLAKKGQLMEKICGKSAKSAGHIKIQNKNTLRFLPA